MHEKIIRRPDGNMIKVTVTLHIDSYRPDNLFRWYFSVEHKEKGKKKWRRSFSTDDYEYRALSGDKRTEYAEKQHLMHATAEEVLEAKMELWNKLKPEI